jgi:hypothetical protein
MDNPDAATPDSASADEAARWKAAAQVRCEHPRWVVIWSALQGEFQARPLFRAPARHYRYGVTPEQPTAGIDAVEMTASPSVAPARA